MTCKKRILITGIDGFIGMHLGNSLVQHGYYVIGVGRRAGKRDLREKYYHEYHNILVSRTLDKNLRRALANINTFIHLSAVTEHISILSRPDFALEYNFLATYHLARLYVNSKARNFIYPSSGKVYGNPQYLPADEKHPLHPVTFLGRYKKMGEDVLGYFSQMSGKSFTVLRMFNVYGPGQSRFFLIPEMMRQITCGNKIVIGNASEKRDYIFIADVVNAFKTVLENPIRGCSVFNVGSGQSFCAKDIVRIMGRLTGRRLVLCVDKQARRKNEPMEEKADVGALSKYGWQPRVTLHQGIRHTIQSKGLL